MSATEKTPDTAPAGSRHRTATLARQARRQRVGRVLDRDEVYGITLRERRGALVVEWEQHRDPFMAGLQLTELRAFLDAHEHELVRTLRATGLSWAEIAGAWQMSRQGMQKKFQETEQLLRADLEVEHAGGEAAAFRMVPAQRGGVSRG